MKARAHLPSLQWNRALLVALLLLFMAAGPAEARTLNVTASESRSEYFFLVQGLDGQNPTLRLEPGEEVTVRFINAGTQHHNLRLGPSVDEATQVLAPGQSETLEFTVPEDADFASQYWCQPHKRVDMLGMLLFGDAEDPAVAAPWPALWVLVGLVPAYGLRRGRRI